MPIRLNVGVSRKVGLPNYGSAGASCGIEIELDGSLLQSDLDGFHRHVHHTFVACQQAVTDQLARQQSVAGQESENNRSCERLPGTNGHADRGQAQTNGNVSSRASQKQLDYAGQLAKQIRGLGVRNLESLSDKLCSKPLADLTTLEASSLIDTLKAIKEERISLDDALTGVSA